MDVVWIWSDLPLLPRDSSGSVTESGTRRTLASQLTVLPRRSETGRSWVGAVCATAGEGCTAQTHRRTHEVALIPCKIREAIFDILLTKLYVGTPPGFASNMRIFCRGKSFDCTSVLPAKIAPDVRGGCRCGSD